MPSGGTLATADAILKDLYPDAIRETVNYRTYLLDRVERDSDHLDFEGRRAIFPVHSLENLSQGSIADGGTLPDPGNETDVDAIVPIRYHAKGLELTDQLIKQAKSNRGAFVNKLDRDTKAIAKGMRKDLGRQLYGDGKGTLAILKSSPAAGTTATVDFVQYLKVGQVVDVRTIADGTLENAGNVNLTITAINKTTKVVTFSGNVTATLNTAGIYLAGNYGLELDGGLRRVGTTNRTLFGIDSSVAGNDFWQPKVYDASGGSGTPTLIGESLFEQGADDAGSEGQQDLEVFISSRGIRRRLADTYQSQKRLNDAKMVEIHGGYTAIYVNEIPLIADDQAPKRWAFGLPPLGDTAKWAEVEQPDWLQDPKTGTSFFLAAGSTLGKRRTAWQAWWVWYANFAFLAPAEFVAITNGLDDA